MATRTAAPADAVAKQEALAVAKNNIWNMLNKTTTKEAIAAALPDMGVTPERVATIAFSVIGTKPELLACDARSLIKVIVEGSILGLSFDPHLKQAHIVPFKKGGVPQATLIVGYMGLVKLARNSGLLSYVDAHVVYEGDFFDFELGIEPRLTHKPPKKGPRGEPIGVYALGKLTNGDTVFRYLTQDEVFFYREKSAAKESSDSPWQTDPMSQWRKTAIRRLMGYMPMDERTQRAVAIDELGETGNDQRLMPMIDDVIEAETVPEKPQRSKTEDKKAALQAEQEKRAAAEGRAGVMPAEATVETPAPSEEEPRVALTDEQAQREIVYNHVLNGLRLVHPKRANADLAVSEATAGKYQSVQSLDDAPVDVLQTVHAFLVKETSEDLTQ